jgi:hypothetical protein
VILIWLRPTVKKLGRVDPLLSGVLRGDPHRARQNNNTNIAMEETYERANERYRKKAALKG